MWQPAAQAFVLNVMGSDGQPVTDYRWLLQEDTTRASIPGAPAVPGENLSLTFHSSYAPVVSKGRVSGGSASPNIPVPDPNKRYFISVLPDGNYSLGGGPVMDPANPAATTTIFVNKTPLPTAQFSVYVFEDIFPINNAPDLPQEHGLAGFSVQVFDAGGAYGANGGRMLFDVYGNPLGTTYDAEGNVVTRGTGVVVTDENGVARIRNLAPGKYTVFIAPPAGEGWVQTATIEGTMGVDAWVKANEPNFFQEFGPPGHHVFIGFTKAINDTTVLTGGSTITGRIVNQHMSRAPEYAFYGGEPVPRCWIGLNEMGAVPGKAIFAAPCNSDSTFSIPNVPAGSYQLVVWDETLDVIFAFHLLDVPEGGAPVALNDVPVFNWFGRIRGQVFYDHNENGFPDPGEPGMPSQAVNLRFRDGSIYQVQVTDTEGNYGFEEVFPFFNWLVAEVDYARFKATGVTVTVDAGGPVDSTDPWSFDVLNPQPQVCDAIEQAITGCAPLGSALSYRTEVGPVLTQGFQIFLGQTNVMQWGKKLFNTSLGEHGGISGMVRYATTRAEDDPRYAVADNWEPGIPNVRINLYTDFNGDKQPDGPPIATTLTDSWDANLPENCQGANNMGAPVPDNLCFDGLRNFNQVRPALFDGGWAFSEDSEGNPLLPGAYIVEVIAPPGYEHVKEEDKNVDFGESYVPSPLALPMECVNWDDADNDGLPGRKVPPYLSLFEAEQIPAPFAGQNRPLCDRKLVQLNPGQNATTDFFLFTEVPVAAQVVGMILNDLANEFDPNAPNFGEKYAPPHVPVSFRDWTGREITRVYADEYGTFNALLPSTYTMNVPLVSGVSPNMLTACMNSPMKADGTMDPWFNRQYTQFCYTFQFMPGKTTYLDTPVLPIAAMAGPGRFPLDCEYGDGTPMISSVTNASQQGPWVPAVNRVVRTPTQLTIRSVGSVEVPNPDWGNTGARSIVRDYGFGATRGTGSVTLGTLVLPIVSWSNEEIRATVPVGTREGNYQLTVTRGNGQSTIHSVTVTISGKAPIVVPAGGSIQAVIDNPATLPGDLISVPPGVYEELLVMHKPVKLQGWGAGSTIINAVKAPAEKLQNWRDQVAMALANGWFDLLPGQTAGGVDPQNNEPLLFNTDEGAGITVVANIGEFTAASAPRIDGFTITGADHGGAIYINGYVTNLEVSNNRLISNQGYFGGGIHAGNPLLLDGTALLDSGNGNLRIHNNQITQNGGLDGAGGGISLYTGSTNYDVVNNFVCGNFSAGGGGGIGHLGRSDNGKIRNNTIIFNESFNQLQTVSGGGILVAGQAAALGTSLSAGAGHVTISGNLIQGNLAGAGDGGGVQTQFVNGLDVAAAPTQSSLWHRVQILNNIIVNNIAGLAGGGLSLHDTTRATVLHNTIANNDSTATAGNAFQPGSPNRSTPQPAGVVSHLHSAELRAALDCGPDLTTWRCFSDPVFDNNIVWHNRSFYWEIDPAAPANPDAPPFGLKQVVGREYDDLGVVGGAVGYLRPRDSILTSLTAFDGHAYDASNVAADPAFVAEYVNVAPGQTIQQPELTTGISTAPALDEGGNFIDVNFGPLTLIDPATGEWFGNYHIRPGSPASRIGRNTAVTVDFDNQRRPLPSLTMPDAGADEIQ